MDENDAQVPIRKPRSSDMIFSEAFARYGAKLRNVQWAVSVIHDDPLVMSCWQHLFKPAGKGELAYEDRLSRFSGPGNTRLREHLETAIKKKLPVRVVIARSSNPEAVNAGEDAGKYKSTYSTKETWVGRVEEFDDDFFRVVFRDEASGEH